MPLLSRASTSSERLLVCFCCGWSNWWLGILINFVKYDILATLPFKVNRRGNSCWSLKFHSSRSWMNSSIGLFVFVSLHRQKKPETVPNTKSVIPSQMIRTKTKTRAELIAKAAITEDRPMMMMEIYANLIGKLLFSPQIGSNWALPSLQAVRIVGCLSYAIRWVTWCLSITSAKLRVTICGQPRWFKFRPKEDRKIWQWFESL